MLIEIDEIVIAVEKIVSDGLDHECEGNDHDIAEGKIYFRDDSDVIMCEDHFWEMIKSLA